MVRLIKMDLLAPKHEPNLESLQIFLNDLGMVDTSALELFADTIGSSETIQMLADPDSKEFAAAVLGMKSRRTRVLGRARLPASDETRTYDSASKTLDERVRKE